MIDDATARLLAKIKWLKPIRLACGNQAMIPAVQKAVGLLRWHNAVPRRYSVYVLVKDVSEALERVRFLKTLNVSPFAQPYRDFNNPGEPTPQQKAFAEWVNQKVRFNSVPWEDYIKTRKEFNNHAELHVPYPLPER